MSAFTKVAALKPPRSVFDLSYEKKFDFDMGQLIPVCCEEMVPGDTFKIGNEIVIRFQPLVAPVLHEVNAYVHYFFVPSRLVFEGWEDYITGGVDGSDSTILPRFDKGLYSEEQAYGPFSLYDYFGLPIIKDSLTGLYRMAGDNTLDPSDPSYFYRPLSFPWRCMNLIWNEYYRDETLQQEVDLDQPLVLHRNWSKDYFTSALPWQQRSLVPPALPISGVLPVNFKALAGNPVDVNSSPYPYLKMVPNALDDSQLVYYNGSSGAISDGDVTGRGSYAAFSGSVDLGGAATVDVSELRLIFQLQKFLERNARTGIRYTEFLHSHFSVSPRDDRLQRPEYLGGSKSPILISEVTQTSQTSGESTPIGRLAGKGITADKNYVCSYHAQEFGYLVGILSVMPKPSYQQGVDAKWLRKSRFDWFFPEFSHLSEQPVPEIQLYAQPGNDYETVDGVDTYNSTIFGYQARFNEMRMNQNKVCGSMRDLLDYWHLGRQFASAPALNSDFITMDADRDDLKRIFAVQNVPGMICNFANIITAIRPLPKFGEPGLIDHY